MLFKNGCWTRARVALVIGTIFSSGCAGAGSDIGGRGACPPVVPYGREVQARVAEELDLLPEGSAIVEMLADYAVLRDQARACR